MNLPITFREVNIEFHHGKPIRHEECQMIITGDYLIINNKPERPDTKTKIVQSVIYPMIDIQAYTTTLDLPEDYKGLITE